VDNSEVMMLTSYWKLITECEIQDVCKPSVDYLVADETAGP
jgi:hypothetical protein